MSIVETLKHSGSGGGYGSVSKDLPVTVDDDEADLVLPQIGGIAAYFTVAYGDNRPAGWGDTILGECHSREVTFRATWYEPRQESPADEWEVSAHPQYGASDLSIEVRYGYGRSDFPELIGSVEFMASAVCNSVSEDVTARSAASGHAWWDSAAFHRSLSPGLPMRLDSGLLPDMV